MYRFVYRLARCLVTRQHFSIMCACIVELLFLLVCILLILLCGSLGSTNIVLPTCATLSMNHEIRSSLNFCTNNWFKLINCILNFAYMHGQQRSRYSLYVVHLVFQRKPLIGDICKRTLSDATQPDKLLQQRSGCMTPSKLLVYEVRSRLHFILSTNSSSYSTTLIM